MRNEAIAVLLACGMVPVAAAAQRTTAEKPMHPRLLVSSKKLDRLRKAVALDGSVHQEVFRLLRDRVQRNDPSLWEASVMDLTRRWAHGRAFKAQGEAMVYLLTEDPGYARMAYETLREIHADAGPEVALPERGPGLGRATVSLGFAFAYDWCHDAWTPAQRAYVRGKILTALEAWTTFHHANLWDVRGSNWAGICRSGELLLLLAAGLEKQRAERFALLKKELALHLRNGYDRLGVTQEGIGYCEYAGIYAIPAVLALRGIGDHDLDREFDRRQWWKQVMYAGTFAVHGHQPDRQSPDRHHGDDHPLKVDRSFQQIFPMSGVSGPTIFDEGWVSLLLATVPEAQMPHYLWWYDRALGARSARKPEHRYDWQRAGMVYALLYYPTDVAPADPTGKVPVGVSGEAGMCYFRNRWRDTGDVVVSITGDAHHHGHAWDQAEALQLGLFAHDTLFIGGPNKLREDRCYSTLLVDGRNHDDQRGAHGHTGTLESFEATRDRGYVVVGGGEKYRRLGVDRVRRHLLVDFAGQAPAVISTLDRIRSTRKHEYAWQINVGSHDDDWGVRVTSAREAGRPTFLLATAEKAFVKGWVLHPAGAEIAAGDPLRVVTTATDADLWIVWVVGRGTPPTASVAGEAMEAHWAAAGRSVRFDGGRVVCRRTDPSGGQPSSERDSGSSGSMTRKQARGGQGR